MSPAALRRLMAWYRRHGRHDLPWRQTRDPYAVLVSEVMLQQTQVPRVLPRFERWLDRWPTAAALAGASRAQVIREWAGLGYNTRAVRLHAAAQAVVERHDGRVPVDVAALRALPGIGPYTAAAVACFAGEARVLPVDTNIGRVLARVEHGVERPASGGPLTRVDGDGVLPRRGARDCALAMMDLGAMVCRARSPGCDDCPLRPDCAWRAAGHPPGPNDTTNREPRFEETARWARGRIVAALDEHGPMSGTELAARLPRRHRERVEDYLRGLERDGLVTLEHGRWGLPGDLRR